MNLILLRPADFTAADEVRLHDRSDDSRARHIRDILGANQGEQLRVGVIDGLTGSAEVLSIDDTGVELRVALTEPPPPKLPLTLILALPRPKVLRRVLRTVAELGVRELILLNTYKVEKSYWQSPALAADQVRGYFLEGLQQSRDTVLPMIRFEKRFKPFVEDRLPALAQNTTALVAHPGGGVDACPLALDRPCTLAVGPEGGFIPYEIEKLKQAGLVQIQLGARILRVENALTTLVAKLFS
jgi:RsmE family RNA methyltransferase